MEDETFCPITHDPFVDPVVCSDGHTYEREAITKCLAMGLPSPSSNLKGVTIVAPNWMARKTIERTYAIELPPSKRVKRAANDDLIRACKTGDLDHVRVSIQAISDVHAVDKYCRIPLHYASYHGHVEITKTLIQARADVNAVEISSCAHPNWTPRRCGHAPDSWKSHDRATSWTNAFFLIINDDHKPKRWRTRCCYACSSKIVSIGITSCVPSKVAS